MINIAPTYRTRVILIWEEEIENDFNNNVIAAIYILN